MVKILERSESAKFLERTPPAWKDITVQELLSHTSGLRGGGWVEWDGSPLLKITTKQMFDDIAKSPLVSASGAGATYVVHAPALEPAHF